MKRGFKAVALALPVILAVSLAFSGTSYGQAFGPGRLGFRGCFTLLQQEAVALGLSEAQQNQIREIATSTLTRTIELNSQAQLARIDIMTALRAPSPDEKAVLQAARKVNSLRSQVRENWLKAFIQVKKILSPEQLDKLNQLRAERWASRKRPFGRMGFGRMGNRGWCRPCMPMMQGWPPMPMPPGPPPPPQR